MKAALSEYRVKLDPVALPHTIREARSALAAVTFPAIRPTPSGESLEQFLAKLPDLWRQDAAHTSRERGSVPSSIRVRSQAFFGGLSGLVVTRPVAPTASLCELLR